MNWLLVFVGGGMGAALRHAVNRASLAIFGPSLPVGTMIVNIIGSLAMGLLVGSLASTSGGISQHLRLFLATGLLGGFTTFSAFSLDALTLWQRGQAGAAFAYVAASVALSLLAIAAGVSLTRA